MNTDLLIIYIRNSRDIYALTEWLQNTLLKKVNRGLTPSVEYLANCSTMKKIVRMAAKMLSDQDHKTATNQKELRRSFWEFCKEFGGEFEREANKKKHSFKLDFNIAFGEYKDGLCKDGIISQSLYQRATLY